MSGRFVIHGAGAVGGVIGGALHLAGHDVALVARGAHHDAMAERGLTLHLPSGRHQLPIPVVRHPDELAWSSDDVVILAVKVQDSEEALAALVRRAPASVAVVCAQNGVEGERRALRRFSRVYAMCVQLPSQHLEPGVVDGGGVPHLGVLDVGRYPTGTDEGAARIAAALTSAGFRSQARADVMRYKYAKLRLNTGNALDAACGRDAFGSDLARRAGAEALAVFAAAGIDVASRDEERIQRDGFRLADDKARGGSSSWQSLARGSGRIETDHLNGEVVLLGRLHGVATPVNEAFRRIAAMLAADGREPGTVAITEVEALVAELEATSG
ncbi:MAG: 2-dehydropantoate 2-reductase [Actinomycetota bacterium]